MSSLATHVILTYNDFDYLLKIIEMSIANSKFIQKDILIIDDGSKEPIEPRINSLYDLEKERILVIRHASNQGIHAAIQTALNHVKTKYVHLGSSNDKICPQFFYEHVNALEKYEFAPFSSSDPGTFEEETNLYSDFKLQLSPIEKFFNATEFTLMYKKNPFHIGSNTILYRTSDLKLIDIKSDLELYADWFINYSLSFKKGFVYIPKVLTYYCIHKNSYSESQLKKDTSAKIIKFFQYIQEADMVVYNRMKEASFISAFPFLDIMRVLREPIIKQCTTTKALFMCFGRQIWHIIGKFLPISFYNDIRKLKSSQ